MRGSDAIITDELYEGTAKSAEGYLAGILFQQAKDEGRQIEINWQDQDSSSEKSFRAVYASTTSSHVMKCGGHVGRAHEKALKELKTKKEFDSGYISKHKADFPRVESVTCSCKGKRHSKGCGCFSDTFIQSARRNLYCAISQCGNDANAFASRMRELGKYHSRDIHEWEGGQCDFHTLLICSCGNCEEDMLTCEGKEYHTAHVLTCPLHALAYEIECHHRAALAEQIIDPDWAKDTLTLVKQRFRFFRSFGQKM